VARIIARYTTEGVHMDESGKKVVKIDPLEYFTAFQFIPSPDGSIYGQGLGALLGNINESVNSLLNQLIDAGTLNNLQSGFLGKGLRIKMGNVGLAPGEWKVVNATGDDLSKSIFPLPSKEPSAVLFQLMNLLIQSGNQLASVAEIMVGKMPGQNTPATTTQETVDQAMKVFTAVYKRNFKALASEFKKVYNLFRVNKEVVEKDAQLLELELQPNDYNGPDDDIIPSADPTGDSVTVRMAKLQQVGQALQFGTINVMEFTKRLLEINEIPNPQALMQQPPPPPPDPKMMAAQAKMQSDQQKAGLDQQMMQMEMQMKAMEMQMKKQENEMKIQMEQTKMALEEAKMQLEGRKAQQEMQIESAKGMMSLQHEAVAGQQKIRQNEESFKQKQAQQKAKPKGSKPKEK
jgi:chaperonin GroES